ncbi:hypothetical protein [Actinoplanes regularis]|nr:hypothetical protein [Actinoplanes regularis]
MDLDLTVLLPHLSEVELEQVEVTEDRVVIHFTCCRRSGPRPVASDVVT